MNEYYVYIMTNIYNTTLYVWVTNNLTRRVYEHKNKLIEWFTAKYNIDKLVYFESCGSIQDAIQREKQIKKWRREKKLWLIKQINYSLAELVA